MRVDTSGTVRIPYITAGLFIGLAVADLQDWNVQQLQNPMFWVLLFLGVLGIGFGNANLRKNYAPRN